MGAGWHTVFGRDGRFVAAAAGPDSHEVASGFVVGGEPLTVQACLARGGGSRVGLRLDTIAMPIGGARHKVQILAVRTPTQAGRNRLMALGFDDTHSHSADELDIVVSGPQELEKLRANGFTWRVEAEDRACTRSSCPRPRR